MTNREQSDMAKPVSTVGKIAAALIGILVAGFCLLVFIFRLSGRILMLDSDLVFFYFVACGAVAGIGLLFVYRLLPRHKPSSLVEQSGGVAIEPLVQAQPRTETGQPPYPPASLGLDRTADAVRNSGPPRHAARYKASEGGGLAAIVVMIGMAIAFMVGSDLARQFLPLVILAGGAVALGMYWYRNGNLA
jgi:hypothetical protein